jgi:hypothetical protein
LAIAPTADADACLAIAPMLAKGVAQTLPGPLPMRRFAWLAAASISLAVGCESSDSHELREPDQAEPPPDTRPWEERYADIRAEAATMSVQDLLERYPGLPTIDALSYEPGKAVGLDEIAKAYPMSAAQRETLDELGFVALADTAAPTFGIGYHEIYDADLPVLITTDSVLHAMHRSLDRLLAQVEQAVVGDLDAMLVALHEEVAADVPNELNAAREELDVLLTVARCLLADGYFDAKSGEAAQGRVLAILADAAAQGVAPLEMFGSTTSFDTSQLTPRGHYAEDASLAGYFRAMMWLSRAEAPIIEYANLDGPARTRFRRTAADAAYLFGSMLDRSGQRGRWERIDRVLERFIGDADNMTPRDTARLVAALGVQTTDDWIARPDSELARALVEGDYGLQRIMSQVIASDPNDPTLRPARSFFVMGQRFTLDSLVDSLVTYDRVVDLCTGEKPTRMLPSALDVQFVLGNDEAAKLLEPELATYGYQGTLHELRFIADTHPTEFWDASFYTGWLSALRALNPQPAEHASYPEPMRTSAWRTKTLQTQAASHAELRHDMILYGKQPYSTELGCMYTDAYVEPAVGFYERMAHVGRLGAAVIDDLDADMHDAGEYFARWTTTMEMLADISRHELAGEELTGEQISFLDQLIEVEQVGCGQIEYDGWYPQLFLEQQAVRTPAPTIADVHTSPTDAAGNEVGWVLHAATSSPMMLVLTVPGCDGAEPRAYVGPIASYHDVLRDGFTRMDDDAWASELETGAPPRPAWIRSFAR